MVKEKIIEKVAHPVKAYFASWIAIILSLKTQHPYNHIGQKTLGMYTRSHAGFWPIGTVRNFLAQTTLRIISLFPHKGHLIMRHLKRELPGITNAMLSGCLRELERDGPISRGQYNEIQPKVEYSNLPMGEDLPPVFYQIMLWGFRHEKELENYALKAAGAYAWGTEIEYFSGSHCAKAVNKTMTNLRIRDIYRQRDCNIKE